ncbi:MAG: flagellar hook assembly protein FlgD [Candidatus Kapaibacteriales bacterium]
MDGLTPVQNNFDMGGIVSTTRSGSLSKDDFLKLLTIQLKTQNPMKPVDNMEFASQLAQFSQLEQLANIRKLLESQGYLFEALAETLQSSSVLGENAEVFSNKIYFDGEKTTNFGFRLDSNIQSAELIIRDSSGNEIRRIGLEPSMLTSGTHQLEWDGKDNRGSKVPAGEYSFQVITKNANGGYSNAETFIFGKIQTIRFKPTGTVIVIDNIELPIKNVISISSKL